MIFHPFSMLNEKNAYIVSGLSLKIFILYYNWLMKYCVENTTKKVYYVFFIFTILYLPYMPLGNVVVFILLLN